MYKKMILALICAATVAFAAYDADGAKAVVGNPLSALIGRPVGDTHELGAKVLELVGENGLPVVKVLTDELIDKLGPKNLKEYFRT